jgi:hypothetical protein
MSSIFKPWTVVGKMETWVRTELIKATALVNKVKTFEQSPAIQTLEQAVLPLIDGIYPAAHVVQLAAIVLKFFKSAVVLSETVEKEVQKTDVEIVQDGIKKLLDKKVIDPTAYSLLMSIFSAYVGANYTAVMGTPIPTENLLANTQAVYDSEKAESVAVSQSIAQVPGHPGFVQATDGQNEPVNSFAPTPATAAA